MLALLDLSLLLPSFELSLLLSSLGALTSSFPSFFHVLVIVVLLLDSHRPPPHCPDGQPLHHYGPHLHHGQHLLGQPVVAANPQPELPLVGVWSPQLTVSMASPDLRVTQRTNFAEKFQQMAPVQGLTPGRSLFWRILHSLVPRIMRQQSCSFPRELAPCLTNKGHVLPICQY